MLCEGCCLKILLLLAGPVFPRQEVIKNLESVSKMMQLRSLLLLIVLVSPINGQLTLPFLYMPRSWR